MTSTKTSSIQSLVSHDDGVGSSRNPAWTSASTTVGSSARRMKTSRSCVHDVLPCTIEAIPPMKRYGVPACWSASHVRWNAATKSISLVPVRARSSATAWWYPAAGRSEPSRSVGPAANHHDGHVVVRWLGDGVDGGLADEAGQGIGVDVGLGKELHERRRDSRAPG